MYKFLFLKTDKKYTKIPYEDIQYVEAVKKYVKIITVKKTFLVLTTLCNVEKKLPDTFFCRIHRSYVASLFHITAFDNEIVWIGEKQLHIGRQYRDVLLSKIIVLNDDASIEIKLSKNDIDEFMKMIKPN